MPAVKLNWRPKENTPLPDVILLSKILSNKLKMRSLHCAQLILIFLTTADFSRSTESESENREVFDAKFEHLDKGKGKNKNGEVYRHFAETGRIQEELIHVHSGNTSNSTIIPQPIYPDCHSFMIELGDFSSDFFKCSVQHSRPFRMCQNCVDQYEKTYNIYQEIIKDNSRDDACRHMLLNSDRVMVITQVVNSVTNIWALADCSKCFNTVTEDVNGTIHHVLSNDTISFLNKYKNMTDCLSVNASEIIPPDLEPLTPDLNNSACFACKTQYNDMNDFFLKMLKDNKQHVCMDLVDMMNYTRIEWSETFHCSHRSGYDAPIILITIVMCILTFLFYCVNQVVTRREERKLMKQKRLTVTVNKRLPSFSHGSMESSVDHDEGIYSSPS